jgi:hypothetical protein
MGTWADDPFGNDLACDWAAEAIRHNSRFFESRKLHKFGHPSGSANSDRAL